MRTVLVFAVLVLTGACTFPDVDYTDSGPTSSSSSGGACAVPSACAADATDCASLAENKHKSCVSPCKTDQTCIAQCDSALQSSRVTCAATCDSCAGSWCGNMPTNCSSLVGL